VRKANVPAIQLYIILLFLIGRSCLSAQTPVDGRQEVLNLQSVIQKYHLAPPSFDDAFSEKVFNFFLESLYPQSMVLNDQDVARLGKYKNNLFQDLNNTWDFQIAVKTIYKARLMEFDSAVRVLLSKPLDFSVAEIYTMALPTFSKSDVHNNIRKYLKYRLLSFVFLANDSGISRGYFNKMEETARKKILRNEINKINRFLKDEVFLDNYITEKFLNAIAQCIDPHSEYMSVNEKEKFNSSLAPGRLSFGFYISTTENDELLIDALVPGGAAWNSKQINKGDFITAFALPGSEKVETGELSPEEVDEILSAPENKEIVFHIRKKDGTTQITKLKKTILNQDNVIVKGYILQGNKKIGYISLPGFYNDFENQSANGCANDVAKECIKFQKENISGLILDLRNNGGGSIKEAIDLSGIFIDYGSVCQLKDNTGNVVSYKDFNRGVAFPGPLVILVNELSASASEIFAGTMQDYNRAVIVGNPTFGKATAQIILPCSPNPEKNQKVNGFIKITTNKIYRITGKSNQVTGVIPDIRLLETYPKSVFGESAEPYSLSNDSTRKVIFTPLKLMPLNVLREKSLTRRKNEIEFTSITDSLRVIFDKKREIPLNFEGYSVFHKFNKSTVDKLQDYLEQENNSYKVVSSRFDETVNASFEDFNKPQREAIEKDRAIHEAYQVINDLIEVTTTK
jgi:carboxyl-terminal processing protease